MAFCNAVLNAISAQGTWVWLADHDLDSDAQGQLTLFSGRGILSESAGPVWLIGTCECLPTPRVRLVLM